MKFCSARSADTREPNRTLTDATHLTNPSANTVEIRYWDVTYDAEDLFSSAILDPHTGFGGDGVGEDHCIQDGPFAGYVNSLGPGYRITDHCIQRRLNETYVKLALPEYIEACYARGGFTSAIPCIEATVHSSGHAGIGGMVSIIFRVFPPNKSLSFGQNF